MKNFLVKTGLVLCMLFAPWQAQAQELYGPSYYDDNVPSFVSEVRLGVFAHDVYAGFIPINIFNRSDFSKIEDINLELLFATPDYDFFRWIGSPRPMLGGTFSLAGRESMAHLALTWQMPFFDTAFFIEGSFGAAVHTGALTGAVAPLRNLGCRVNFYEAAGIGMNLSENLTAMLTYEHTSNLELCAANEGLSNLGVRVGYKF